MSRFLLRHVALVGVVAGLVFLAPAMAAASGVVVSERTGAPDFFPDVAESPDGGQLVAAWITDEANLRRDVRVATSLDGGQSWSPEVVVYQGARGAYLQPARIIYDTTGAVHLVFMAGLGSGRTVYHRYLPPGRDPAQAGDWRSGQTVCQSCLSPDLAVDDAGHVYVSYEATEGTRRLGIRRSSGPGAWGPERSVSVGDSVRGAIAVTSDGRIHLAYHTAGQRVASYARYTSYDDFSQEIRLDLGTGAAEPPDIAAGPDGNVHIVYESGNRVFYRLASSSGELSDPEQLTGTLSGTQNVTVTVDSQDQPYVSWTAANFREVHAARHTGGGWQSLGRLSDTGVVARYQEFGYSYHGRVYLAYVEGNDARIAMLSGDELVTLPGPGSEPSTPASPSLPANAPTARQAPPSEPSPDRPYFPETGQYLAGGFRAFWEQNGGLPIFGFPLTTEFEETNPETGQPVVVQYLERQRFEYHPEHVGTPYETQLGRLGEADARMRGLLGEVAFEPRPAPDVSEACEYIAETGHQLCLSFRDYWHRYGLELGDDDVSVRESVSLFGFPISEAYVEPESGLTVQYFERARLEFHADNAPGEQVQVARLAAAVLADRGW